MNNLLKDHSLKITACRMAIIDYLNSHQEPITAESIYIKLKKKYDLATIYRNLEIFGKQKIVFKENIQRTDYYYLAESPHHHIVCRQCQIMECVPCHHDKLSVKNFTNIYHQLLLTGTCQQCSRA